MMAHTLATTIVLLLLCKNNHNTIINAQTITASYDPTFNAPSCLTPAMKCETDNTPGGGIYGVSSFEYNSPNTIDSCNDYSNSIETPQVPQNFYEAHNGAWITTFSSGSQTLMDINDNGIAAYFRTTNSGCWSVPSPLGGQSTITSNTPEELLTELINVPAENIFSGEDLEILLDNGYDKISVAASYLDTPPSYISFAQIFYAGYFEIELLTISGNFGLQGDDFTYSLCFQNPEEDDKMMNRKYEIENKARAILKK